VIVTSSVARQIDHTKVLVGYASRFGSTGEIAARISVGVRRDRA
jgi:hypothetical protein